MSAEPVHTLKPGLLRGLTFDEYARIDAANSSMLKLFRRSAAHAREAMVRPSDQTDEQRIGHVCHAAILEPERFEAEFIPAPKVDKRTREGKATWATFQADHAGHTVVAEAEFDLARALRDSVWAHPTARLLLQGKGLNEVVSVWRDPVTGLLCKSRYDRMTALNGWSVIVDLKTAADASRRAFERSIAYYGYAEQAAFYLDGANALAPRERKFIFIAVEKVRPYAVAVYELDEDAVQLGRDDYQRHLRTYAECVATGQWPGYPDGIDLISLPPWAFRAIEGD